MLLKKNYKQKQNIRSISSFQIRVAFVERVKIATVLIVHSIISNIFKADFISLVCVGFENISYLREAPAAAPAPAAGEVP